MLKDKMTTEERMKALLTGEALDRVPCIPFIFGHVAVVCGQSIGKIYEDAETSFMCQLYAKEMYGYDGALRYGYASFGGWEFGGELEFPYKQYAGAPFITKHPVENESDALNLEVPENIATAGSIPIAFHFSKLQERHNMPITVQVGTPFTFAGSVIGVDRMMRWVQKKPDLVHRVLRKVTDFCIRVIDLWVKEFGAEKMMVSEASPLEDNHLISPKHFETFSLPYIKEIHEKIKEANIPMIFIHLCGEQNKNLHFWQQIPYPKKCILSFGQEVSLKKASKLFPKHIIAGNVDPVSIQENSAEEVFQKCCQVIDEGKEHPGGYVLMAGCEVAPFTPPVNVYMMVKAAREHGVYY